MVINSISQQTSSALALPFFVLTILFLDTSPLVLARSHHKPLGL